MNKTMVRFYRGTHGMGIVISVTNGTDRVIFDFGAPFTPLAQVYDGTLLPRNVNRVKDAILLERIPAVEGVFSRKDLQDLPVISYEESSLNTAVMICHLHLDHMSEIDKIAPEIPVYIHEEGLKLLNALQEVNEEKAYRSYSSFRYHETFKVGQISVTPYFSDHPCPGSAGFLIETSDSTIYYSGDIRFHGLDSKKALAELDVLAQKHIDLLIVDATTTSPSEFTGEIITEQDIYDDIYDHLNCSASLGIFNQYNRDIAMMQHMNDLGKRLDRTVVWEPEYAYILKRMTGIKVPVYWIDSQHIPECLANMKNDHEVISVKDIRNHPEKYLIQNSYGNILSLSDFDGLPGEYFHLFGEPLVKGQKDYQIMVNVVNKLNWKFNTYTNLYSFSHRYPEHLRNLVDKINAVTVVAVHSRHPENLDPVRSIHFFPEENTDYILENGILKQ